ncbi:MAG TPA: glucosaminidase domain-containing protein [Crocinitomicaceae bacterium]|nr:glucosaminidase domain-containing protein [Crocinitomicaceae bacterium]
MKKSLFVKLLIIAVIAVVLAKTIFKKYFMNLEFTYNASSPQKNWIEFMTPLAKYAGKKYGLPWQALVVQTALETTWGKSKLFAQYNNFGGIKATGNEPSVSLGTKECNGSDCYSTTGKFAVYKDKLAGLEAYANFFHKNKRYATALKYPNDPYKFIEEIKKAGYATAPNYTATLHSMLNKYFA